MALRKEIFHLHFHSARCVDEFYIVREFTIGEHRDKPSVHPSTEKDEKIGYAEKSYKFPVTENEWTAIQYVGFCWVKPAPLIS